MVEESVEEPVAEKISVDKEEGTTGTEVKSVDKEETTDVVPPATEENNEEA